MKLEEIARKSIDIIKEHGSEGVTTSYLADILSVPKRRVYDVKAIMKAAGLINTHRDRNGTRLFWNQINDSSETKQVSKFKSKKIKITTTGLITNISNRGTEVIIEGTLPSMTIESIE